jgi:hypothetical protein
MDLEKFHESNHPLKTQIKDATEKKITEEVKKELESNLQQLYTKNITVEKLNNAFAPVINDEKEKLQYLELGEAFIEYVELNKKQSEDIAHLIQHTSEIIAKLKIATDKRFAENLTQDKISELLRRTYNDYAHISATISSQKIADEFSKLKEENKKDISTSFNEFKNYFIFSFILSALCLVFVVAF